MGNMDFSKMDDGSGLTADEKIQQEFGGEQVELVFCLEGESKPIHSEQFKSGVTFEWVKNKIAEVLFAKYQDLHLFMNEKRIPEPFCLVDMKCTSGQVIFIRFEEGAIHGEEAMR